MLKHYRLYNDTLVYKVFCANKPGVVVTDLDQTLEIIKKVHRMTGGIKQIVYLVGWQYDGHDSKYPAWFEVNERLKRPNDASARDSLTRLMSEAFEYNAVVSLHIDMCIAFENSPLWNTYFDNGLLAKNDDGSLMEGGVWGGEQSYVVSKTLEWKKGYAQKRIDGLLELLPELKKAGTIHIDVFQPYPCKYYNVTRDDEIAAMKGILTYWNSLGLDVTTEWFHFEFEGYVPMALHFNLSESSRLKYHSSVICGGGDLWNARNVEPKFSGSGDYVFTSFTRPEEGCLYEEVWGRSMDIDFTGGFEQYFKEYFYLTTLPWCYLNTQTAVRHTHTNTDYSVEYSDGAVTNVAKQGRYFTLKERGRTLIDGGDVFMPAVWTEGCWILYSKNGGSKTWPMPEQWKNCGRLKLRALTSNPAIGERLVNCESGYLNIEMEPLQAFVVTP